MYKIEKANAYSLRKFNKKILKLIEHFNSDKVDRLKRLKNEANALRDLCIENTEKLIDK